MKGSIRERSPGRWAIIIDDPNSGTRKRRWHSFKGSKRQAQVECARLISEMQNGSYLAPDKTTFAEFAERPRRPLPPKERSPIGSGACDRRLNQNDDARRGARGRASHPMPRNRDYREAETRPAAARRG